MDNWITVIVPTFYNEDKELDIEKLKTIANNSGLDTVTIKNALIGKGVGFILKTHDISKIERIEKAFNEANIPALSANTIDVNNEIEVVFARTISSDGDGMRIVSSNDKAFYVKEKIILISDVLAQQIFSVKKAVVLSNRITLITRGRVFVVDFQKVSVITPDGKKGVSQKANLIQLLERIKEKGNLIIDSSFYFQSGFFMKDIIKLSMFVAYAFKHGLYEKDLPESLFVKGKAKKRPVYNHRVIKSPFKKAAYLYRMRIKDNVVYPSMFWIVVMLFLISIGARFGNVVFLWLGFLIGVFVFTYKFFRILKMKHLIEDTPTSKLRSVAAGFVEVTGKITSNKPVISPISGAPCVFFRYFKEAYVRRGRRSYWKLVEIGDGFAEHCVLKDETGEIGVNIKNSSFFLTNKYTTNTRYLDVQYGLFSDGNVRYTEEYILDGQKVYVLGTARPESRTISYGRFLSEIKKDEDTMREFDLDGNGVIDPDEWEMAQKDLKNRFLEYKQLKGQGAELVIDLNKNNGVFIISNEEESNLLMRLKFVLPLYFVASLACFVLTLWLTFKIF